MKTARKLTVPVPGQRIFRTMVAVWLCLAVYLLRGHRGLPTFAVLAAIAGIQPYYKDMRASARRRMIGNLTGGVHVTVAGVEACEGQRFGTRTGEWTGYENFINGGADPKLQVSKSGALVWCRRGFMITFR